MKLFPEDKLAASVERIIKSTNDGVTPSDAVEKEARDQGYNPATIRFISGAFNKSRSVAFMKQASADVRAMSFPLADAEAIIKNIYPGKESLQKKASVLPGNLTEATEMQKVASSPVQELPFELRGFDKDFGARSKDILGGELQKLSMLIDTVKASLDSSSRQAEHEFNASISKLASELRPLTKPELQKVAQLVVNGYQETGDKFLKLVEKSANVTFPTVEKTAHAAVFPLAEPYLSITNVYTKGIDLRNAKNAVKVFEKEAGEGVFGGTLMGNVLADALQNEVGVSNTKGLESILKDPQAIAGGAKVLDPEFKNNLKAITTRQNFMKLVLYDEDLKNYNLSDLVNAYNATVTMAPDMAGNTPVLRNLMLRYLETSGKMDPFEIKAVSDLNKNVRDQEKSKADTELSRASLKEKTFPKSPEIEYYEPGKTKIAGGLVDKASDLIKTLGSDIKAIGQSAKKAF